MATHIIFVAIFSDDQIEVSTHLPKDRKSAEFLDSPISVRQGYSLLRLRIEAEELPILPDGDLTEEQYRDWLSIIDQQAVIEEKVDPLLVAVGHGGLCVSVRFAAVDAIPYGTLAEVTVDNVGPYPIGKLQVVWHGNFEPAYQSTLIGEGYHFVPVGEPAGQLLPGQSRPFALMAPKLQKCLNFAMILPPDQYHIGVHASLPGQEVLYEIYRLPGIAMAEMIDTLERFLRSEKK